MDYKLYNNINEIQNSEKDVEVVKQELYALWQKCFGDSQSYTDFYFKWKVEENQILSIYRQDKLSSMLHLNPYILMVQGKETPANYIVGVATRQQDRRQGLMKMLLEASIYQMYQEHMPFTYLMPAAEAIYLPFGFRIVYEQEPWNRLFLEEGQVAAQEIDPEKKGNENLNNGNQDNLTVIPLNADNKERIEQLVSFSNEKLSQEYDIYVKRTSYYYNRFIHEMECTGGKVLLCYCKEKLVGYAAYMAEGGIYIAECIYSEEDKAIVVDAISAFILRSEDRLPIWEEHHNTPTIMARIVDWNSFVHNISASEEIKLTVEVKDSIIEENNGVYTLYFTTLGCDSTRSIEEPEVSADISDLSKLFFGKMSEQDLTAIIKGNDKEYTRHKLALINSYKKIFINDVV